MIDIDWDEPNSCEDFDVQTAPVYDVEYEGPEAKKDPADAGGNARR